MPQYSIVATNVGDVPTSGPIMVTDTLPAGLTASVAFGRDIEAPFFGAVPCEVVGQVVTCTSSNALQPGGWLQAVIPVEVAPAAPASVSNEATVSGGGAANPASATTTTTIGSSTPPFEFLPTPAGLGVAITAPDAGSGVQAGSRPYQLTVDVGLPSAETGEGEGSIANAITAAGRLRDLTVNLPPGVIVNPNATPIRCTEAQLEGAGCPDASQVGTVTVLTSILSIQPSMTGVYNMVPPVGAPASLGFNALDLGIFVHAIGGVRTGGDYGLSATTRYILARTLNPIYGAQVQLWGDPSASSHDSRRGKCILGGGSCPVTPTTTPFLTMPGACSSSLNATAAATSWEEPNRQVSASTQAVRPGGGTVAVSGCERLGFSPTLTLRPDVSTAETPSGLHVNLHVPQTEGHDTLATANLKDAKVTLPAGVAVNPSAANGLGACTEAEIELKGPEPARCPDDSKIGTVEVDTPLLDHPLPGAVYAAKPRENPFGSLLAIYIAVHDPQSGVVVKLAGQVKADPSTGQLTTTFSDNPQLPFEHFRLDFFGGPRAPLATPPDCGGFTTRSELSPWSGTPAVDIADSFQITRGAAGGPCTSGEASRPNNPDFAAGTLTPLAGSYSPFVTRLERHEGAQKLKGLNLILPPGLSGKLAGVTPCPEAAIAASAGKSGAAELASSSCPPASAVGTVTVGAGAGSQPYYVNGTAYLTGPYKGAPLGLAIVTPAVAGPFDLGVVVVRSALHVDPRSAQITVRSDPFPTILEGIPLLVRDIRVDTSRPQFTLNPTNCEPMSVEGEAISVTNQAASLADRFQVGGCRGLELGPRLLLRLFGGTRRGAHPKLRAVLMPRAGDANIGRASVALPRSEFLDQGNIGTVCTRVQFAADACPEASVYGRAVAHTPLLDQPLRGPVYLRSSDNKLPDLVASLHGPAHQPIKIELVGRVDTIRGGIRTTFESAPDAPVSKFILLMKGGPEQGLLINSRNICAKRFRATVKFRGHNDEVTRLRPVLKNGKCDERPK